MTMRIVLASHPLDPLNAQEIKQASAAVQAHLGLTPVDNSVQKTSLRFVAVTLKEPPKQVYIAGNPTPRMAEIVTLNPSTSIASEFEVDLEQEKGTSTKELPRGTQPLLTPEYCDLAEAIAHSSEDL